MPDEIIQENTRSKKWIWVSIAVLVVVAIVIIVLVAGPKKNSKQGDSSGLSGQGETFDPSFPPREYYQEPTALPGAPEGRMFLELASASADSRRPKPMASDEECAAGVLRPVGLPVPGQLHPELARSRCARRLVRRRQIDEDRISHRCDPRAVLHRLLRGQAEMVGQRNLKRGEDERQ